MAWAIRDGDWKLIGNPNDTMEIVFQNENLVAWRNGRDGEPLKNGINVVPWAIGQVVEVVHTVGEIRQVFDHHATTSS